MANDKLFKSPQEIKADTEASVISSWRSKGVAITVTDASPYGVLGTMMGDVLSPAYAAISTLDDRLFADTAQGEDLDRLLAEIGLSRRLATPSYGRIQIKTLGTTFVPEGASLTSDSALEYVVMTGGWYANNAYIDITSKNPGEGTNLPGGTALSWGTTPGGAESKAVVMGDMTGGTDPENDEAARARYSDYRSNPPTSGNAQHCSMIAETASNAVQKAFTYPAPLPGQIRIAVAGYPSTGQQRSREISTFQMNQISNFTKGNLPEGLEIGVTTVEDFPVNVSILLSIQLQKGALSINGGPGTGIASWLDISPWPLVRGGSFETYAPVISKSGEVVIIAAAPDRAPIAGVTRISWIDRSQGHLVRTGTVTSAGTTMTPGEYVVTLDSGFTGLNVGDWVFPAAANMQGYVDTFFTLLGEAGPGEITANPSMLINAARRPVPQSVFPYGMDATFLRKLEDAHPDIFKTEFHYRSATVPPVPANFTQPPRIFVPGKIGFYPPNPL